MQSLIDSIALIIKALGPENNAVIFVSSAAFVVIGFALYVLLVAIKILASKEKQ